MSLSHHSRPLQASIERGELVIRIGVATLLYAVTYAEWANPYDDTKGDYRRTFAITDADLFSRDVLLAMLSEKENGASLLSEFLDKVSVKAVEQGSEGLHCKDVDIAYGETHALEMWIEMLPGK